MVGAIRDGHHRTARALEPFGRLSDVVKIFFGCTCATVI